MSRTCWTSTSVTRPGLSRTLSGERAVNGRPRSTHNCRSQHPLRGSLGRPARKPRLSANLCRAGRTRARAKSKTLTTGWRRWSTGCVSAASYPPRYRFQRPLPAPSRSPAGPLLGCGADVRFPRWSRCRGPTRTGPCLSRASLLVGFTLLKKGKARQRLCLGGEHLEEGVGRACLGIEGQMHERDPAVR